MTAPAPLTQTDIDRIQALLDALPRPLEPLDVCMLDGYLCAVLVQPRRVATAAWWPGVLDLEGRKPPPTVPLDELQALVLRRHAELDAAIERRDWFDPWVYELGEDTPPGDTVMPWVAGFATACALFPELMDMEDPALLEPLAMLYMHLDPDDLEDADELIAEIETLEPPAEVAEAVESLVRSTLLIADVTRPQRRPAPVRPAASAPRKSSQRTGTPAKKTARRAGPPRAR